MAPGSVSIPLVCVAPRSARWVPLGAVMAWRAIGDSTGCTVSGTIRIPSGPVEFSLVRDTRGGELESPDRFNGSLYSFTHSLYLSRWG
jgi:hypothetical protein